nr:ribonuclease H-like domain-containing protein [Tanacetum cinerariifolium]
MFDCDNYNSSESNNDSWSPINLYDRIPLHKVTTAARPIGAARPTFSKTRPHIALYTVSKSKAPIRRPFIKHKSPNPSISPPRVNAANPSVVSAARVNVARRHMTGNISYLFDFEELNRGYVAFGGNPKGGKITGKGKIKTGKLDFDDVYYVKELKFNLFSVSQMCDKKNNVLFTDTECLVLSSDFKLPDASQVLLRVLRENNMYNNMFEKTHAQDIIWRSQQTEHGQTLVKSWKLLTSSGVHIITFTTTMFVLLVEKKYPLSRFILEQLVNVLLELMLLKRPKENTKCVNAAGEELTTAKHKLELKLFRDAVAAAHIKATKLEKSHDPLALVAHTGSSSRNTSSYYVTHPTSVVDYDDEYQQDDIQTNSKDPLTSAINQAVIQGDRVNIQSRNSGNAGRNNRRAYVQEEVVEGSNETGNVQRTPRNSSSGNTLTIQCYNYSGKGHYARNCPKPRVRDSKYFMEQMLLAKQDEAGVLKNINEDKNYLNESLEADQRAKHFDQQAQSQFIRDRDIIQDLEKQRDKLVVNDYKQKNEEFQEAYLILKRQMSEKEDSYHHTIIDLEEKLKKNVDLILKVGNSLQGMFMLGPKPLSVYDHQLKHGLGYSNPYTLKQAIGPCPNGCSTHMTGDRSLLRNFIEKFMGTICFRNDNFAAITGYGDYIQGNITICHIYYVEGLGHNLFSVRQFCDGDLEVAFHLRHVTYEIWKEMICSPEDANLICILCENPNLRGRVTFFENMLQVREVDAEEVVQIPAHDDVDQENVTEEIVDDVAQPTSPLPPSSIIPSSPPHQSPRASPSQVAEGSSILIQVKKLERFNKVKGRQADIQVEIFNIDLDHTSKVLSMQEDTEVQQVVKVMNATKLMTEVATTAASILILAAEPAVVAISAAKPAAKPKVLKVVPVAPTVSTRKRKGVVIRDPEKELHDTPAET